jgi:hypothetical protein
MSVALEAFGVQLGTREARRDVWFVRVCESVNGCSAFLWQRRVSFPASLVNSLPVLFCSLFQSFGTPIFAKNMAYALPL